MRKIKCPKEEELILLVFDEIEDKKEKLIHHLSFCYSCQQKLKNYEKTIQKLQENKYILNEILAKEGLQKISRFSFSKILLHSSLTLAFIGFLLFVFIMYPKDQTHKDNVINQSVLKNDYLERIIFEFEEIEEEVKGGVIYSD
ncbi:MAG: hypothetical protein ACK4GR_01610 [bacterium]